LGRTVEFCALAVPESHNLLKTSSDFSKTNSEFASIAKDKPSENERILICDLGASVGYERVERVFNTPRLKSQIRILSFSEGVSFACGKSPTHVYVWEQFSSPVLS